MSHETDFEIELEDGRMMYFIILTTSWGSGPTMPSWNYPGDPGDPPEWEVVVIDVAPDARADYARVLPIVWVTPWWRELWHAFTGRPITTPNPEWAALEKIAIDHVERNYDFEPPEPDYYDYEDERW